ncbi:HsdM family class I SAM-dependent methyltransferase [Nocardia acidivorans]|uniref:HsdM family class I SAM-dependent methyltransferase n=1 Tax=Nocardia acidivorans TaxID=404580 RepID=UPI000830FED3|nr:class I SAM-dependent DNA methyltransferase [Nocardia acidivorans]
MHTTDLAQKVFKAADVLRGAMDTAQYMGVISVVLSLKWASEHPDRLTVPEEAQWDRVVAAMDRSPSDALNKAVTALVSRNRDVFTDLVVEIAPRTGLSDAAARQLVSIVDEIPFGTSDPKPDDEAGQVFEQILDAFADRDRRVEFYTPRSLVQLMVRLADPQPGDSIYDPCVGTGGLLTAAHTYLSERSGQNSESLTFFGQDINLETCAIAKRNLMLHGITNASILRGDALIDPRHLNDSGSMKRFDRVLADPPLGLRYQQQMLRVSQQTQYGQSGKADLMFVQHVLASLAPAGTGVMAVPYGALFRGGAEGLIRRGIVQDGRIAAVIGLGPNLFNRTSIPICLLVLRGTAGAESSEREVLFINAQQEFAVDRSKNHLAPSHIEKIATAFRERREISNFARLVPIEEIAANDFNLNVGHYVDSQSLTHTRPSIDTLLTGGGVPVGDIQAQHSKFAAFGIDLRDLFVPGKPGHLDFPLQGCDTTAATIPTLTAATEATFATAVSYWFQEFQREQSVLVSQQPADAQTYFAERFRHALITWKILDDEQLKGLFVDWWTRNQKDLDQLPSETVTNADKSKDAVEALIPDRIGVDLVTGVMRLVAHKRNQLIDTYLAWGDQYKTSLEQLERRREQVSSRLAKHLHKLGYQWPV